MERDYHGEARRHQPGGAWPMVTRNILPDGSPIEVRDEHHLRSLLKEHNLIHRDDAAFAEPAEERFNWGRYDHESKSWKGRGMERREGRAGGRGRWI